MAKRSSPVVRLRSAILLEQIRVEASGKRMLLGAYSDNVIFQRRPAIFNAIVLAAFDLKGSDAMTIRFRASAPNFLGVGEVEVSASDAKNSTHVEVEAPFTSFITDPDKVFFDWKVNEGSWQPAIEWKLDFVEGVGAAPPEEIAKLRTLFEFQAQLQGGSPMVDAQMEMAREGTPPPPIKSGD